MWQSDGSGDRGASLPHVDRARLVDSALRWDLFATQAATAMYLVNGPPRISTRLCYFQHPYWTLTQRRRCVRRFPTPFRADFCRRSRAAKARGCVPRTVPWVRRFAFLSRVSPRAPSRRACSRPSNGRRNVVVAQRGLLTLRGWRICSGINHVNDTDRRGVRCSSCGVVIMHQHSTCPHFFHY